MKHFTKLLASLALLSLLLTFIACSNGSNSSEPNDTPTIVTDFEEGITVWEGTVKFLIDENKEWYSEPTGFISTSFQNVREGDTILIIHTDNGSASEEPRVFEFRGYNWKGKFTLNGKTINATVGTWGEDNHSYLQPLTNNQTTAISLSASDAEIINSTGGMIVYGNGFTVEKIVVVSATVTIFTEEELKINEDDITVPSLEDMKNKILYIIGGFHSETITDGISYSYFVFSEEVENGALKGTVYHYDYDAEGKKASENYNTNNCTYENGNINSEDGFNESIVKFKDEIYQRNYTLGRTFGTGLAGLFYSGGSREDGEGNTLWTQEEYLSLKSNGEITLEWTYTENDETESGVYEGTYTISDGLIKFTVTFEEQSEEGYGFYYGDEIELVQKIDSISVLPPYEDLEL